MCELLSDERLEEIQRRHKRSTPGEWLQQRRSSITHEHGLFYWTLSTIVSESHNAEFIAHAHQDVPAMLDHIEAQAAQLAELRGRERDISEVDRLACTMHHQRDDINDLNTMLEAARKIVSDYSTALGNEQDRAQIAESKLVIAEDDLEAVREVARYDLYHTPKTWQSCGLGYADGWRPTCQNCASDVDVCCCELLAVRDALGIVPPVDAEGNIVDQEAFDAALSRAKEQADGLSG